MTTIRLTRLLVLWTVVGAAATASFGTVTASAAPAGTVKINALGYPIFAIEAAHSIWVGAHHSESIYRIDPASNRIIKTIALPNTACGEPSAGFGSIFFANCEDEGGNTMQLSTKTNKVVRTLPGGSPIVGDGSVWTLSADGGTVYRYDPQTGVKLASVPTNFEDPNQGEGSGLGTAGAGSIWAADNGTTTVLRISTATNKVVAVIPLPGALTIGATSQGYAAGGPMVMAGGKVWFGNPAGVFEIDTATNIATRLDIRIGDFTFWGDIPFATGDGDVWVRTSGSRVVRIDPATGNVVASYPTTGGGGSISVAFGSLWTANAGSDTVWRQAIH